MLQVARPGHSPDDTFQACNRRVKDALLRHRLDAASAAVVTAGDDYELAMLRGAPESVTRDRVPAGVTIKEMLDVYANRMAKKGAPGRRIYDDLLAAPRNGICPLCGQRSVTTLDHYLPQSVFPDLVVVPLNLVPACTDCNRLKRDRIPGAACPASLHPYFDDVDSQQWLSAEVLHTSPASMRFYVLAPAAWDADVTGRVEAHFELFGLAGLYATQAAEELSSVRHELSGLRDGAGTSAVRSELAHRAVSRARVRRNGWQTACYEAWSRSDWFCEEGFRT